MPVQDHMARTTLLRAYLLSMLGVATLFAVLAVGIWVYTEDVLDSEKTLITVLLPELDSAYQLTASTASLQSKSALLSAAADSDQLSSTQAALVETIEHAHLSIDKLADVSVERLSALSDEVDKISANVDALVALRTRQLQLSSAMDVEKAEVVTKIRALEKLMQLRVISLTDKLYETDAAISQSDVPSDIPVEFTVNTNALPSELVASNKVINLAIQDYLLLEQGAVSLGALVERLRLLDTQDGINAAAHERDFLISSLVSRSIYLDGAENSDELLLALHDIRSRLLADDGLFTLKSLYLTQTSDQALLDEQMQGEVTSLLQQTNQIRNDLRSTVNELATVTLSGLDRYRFFLVAVTVITMTVLALISYWLLYRKTVMPLVQITDQLETVGTDQFPAASQSYLLLELAKLAQAISQLDKVQKDLLSKDSEMQRINKDLKKANQDLEQFAHVASHDLQEPLRKLKQFSDLLNEDYEPVLDEEGRYYLTAIRSAAKRMSVLIKETLAYSRAGSANQVLEEVDLSHLLTQLRDEMTLTIKEASAVLDIAPLPVVKANSVGMAQLFRNLLTNALKYRTEGSPANISLSAETIVADGAQYTLVHVRDKGVGIKEKFFERIFNPFERVHAGEVQGTGLGLAICAKVCDAHGWTLKVASVVDEGTTFTVQIPQSSLYADTG